MPRTRGSRSVQLLRRSQLSQAPKRLILRHLWPMTPSTTVGANRTPPAIVASPPSRWRLARVISWNSDVRVAPRLRLSCIRRAHAAAAPAHAFVGDPRRAAPSACVGLPVGALVRALEAVGADSRRAPIELPDSPLESADRPNRVRSARESPSSDARRVRIGRSVQRRLCCATLRRRASSAAARSCTSPGPRCAASLLDCGHHLSFETSPCRLRACGSSRHPTGLHAAAAAPAHAYVGDRRRAGSFDLRPRSGSERPFRALEAGSETCSSNAEATYRKRRNASSSTPTYGRIPHPPPRRKRRRIADIENGQPPVNISRISPSTRMPPSASPAPAIQLAARRRSSGPSPAPRAAVR